MTKKSPHPALKGILLALVSMGAFYSADALACDSCNEVFRKQVMAERSDSLTGKDMLQAMENQKGLPIGNEVKGNVVLAQADIKAPKAAPTQVASVTPDAKKRVAKKGELNPIFEGADFIDIIERDENLSIRTTSFVPQNTKPDKTFTIELNEGKTYIGQGVVYDGFLMDGGVPGQTIVVQEGDIVEMKIKNTGSVPHGASIHAAYTQTSKYVGKVQPGETKSVVFRATVPGVYMYHCAPGGHAIPMHVLFGQYGMMVVEPKETKYKLEEELGRKPDINLYLLQHEFYASGADAINGDLLYTAFNGKVFRYVEEPIVGRPGDYVRIHYLNIGPNRTSTFHIVGILWDYAYWQGHPDKFQYGGQSITSGPTDSWVVEFRLPPDEGSYLMLDHAVGATSRGSIGVIVADGKAEPGPKTYLAEAPAYTEAEKAEQIEKATRTISPFGIGNSEADRPVYYGPEQKEVFVKIIGNSFHPKVIEIEPGTKVTWINEDVFTYMAGEYSGIHNAIGINGPERFATPLLAHAETASHTFTTAGENEYMCAPHPYMKGKIIVRQPKVVEEPKGGCSTTGSPAGAAGLALIALGLLFVRRRN